MLSIHLGDRDRLLILFSDTGLLFTCGDGSFGQLRHGGYKSQCTPVKISYFSSKHVDPCGMRHSLVLLKGNFARNFHGLCSVNRKFILNDSCN